VLVAGDLSRLMIAEQLGRRSGNAGGKASSRVRERSPAEAGPLNLVF
jgi:hypothetical protein